MIKFTPYFYKFKSMILDKTIPVEFRAMFLEDKGMATMWKKRYNYNMHTDTEVSEGSMYRDWRKSFWHVLKTVSVKDLSSIMEFDMQHPEITPSDLIVALILWGRGPAIVKTILELNTSIPEYQEFKNLLDESKRWRKERKTLPKKQGWMFR